MRKYAVSEALVWYEAWRAGCKMVCFKSIAPCFDDRPVETHQVVLVCAFIAGLGRGCDRRDKRLK